MTAHLRLFRHFTRSQLGKGGRYEVHAMMNGSGNWHWALSDMAMGFLHHQPEENLCFCDHSFQLCGSKLPLTVPWGLNVLICGDSKLSLKAFGNSQAPLAAFETKYRKVVPVQGP